MCGIILCIWFGSMSATVCGIVQCIHCVIWEASKYIPNMRNISHMVSQTCIYNIYIERERVCVYICVCVCLIIFPLLRPLQNTYHIRMIWRPWHLLGQIPLSYSYQFGDLAALAPPGPDSLILTPSREPLWKPPQYCWQAFPQYGFAGRGGTGPFI